MAKETRPLTQMYRIDGKEVFMEVSLDALAIDRVKLKFVRYNASLPIGQRYEAVIDIYLGVFEARRLSFDIQSGRISELGKISKKKSAEESQKTGKKQYPKAVFLSQGGTRAKDNNGHPIARTMELAPGNKLPWVFFAKRSTKAHETPEGLIVMDGVPEDIIMIPVSNDALKEFSFALEYIAEIWALSRFSPVIKDEMKAATKERQALIQQAVEERRV